MKRFRRFVLGIAVCGLSLNAINVHAKCEMDNAALQAMPEIVVTIERNDAEPIELPAIWANTTVARGQGFQRVCADRIAQTPMLFTFSRPVSPSFHMRNVVAPLDIAFIDARGRIESIQSMAVYEPGGGTPMYSPRRPIVAALEFAPGLFESLGVDRRSVVRWQVSETTASPE